MDVELMRLYSDVVSYFGGQSDCAAALEVSQGAVSQWVTGKACMSAETAFDVEEKTGAVFSAKNLCKKKRFKATKPATIKSSS